MTALVLGPVPGASAASRLVRECTGDLAGEQVCRPRSRPWGARSRSCAHSPGYGDALRVAGALPRRSSRRRC